MAATTKALKIMIVDDNDAYREFLAEVAGGIEGAEIVAAVSSGRLAITRLKQVTVDLVLLDIEMPLMDGVETLEKIREAHPEVGVIMVSAFHYDGTDKVIRALEMGALDFVSKVGMDDDSSTVTGLRRRLMTLLGLFRARRNARLTRNAGWDRSATAAVELARGLSAGHGVGISNDAGTDGRDKALHVVPFKPKILGAMPKIEVLAIGVSTGGPSALTQVIPLLPRDLGVPVLLVQHMPALLTASLADSLDRKSALDVREAVDGEPVEPGTVYLAPGGKHMAVVRGRSTAASSGTRTIRLLDDPPVNSCRPSADVLFSSISEAYDGTVLALVMTGMGSDGMDGIRVLKRKHCYCLAQTEETCVVYGMPRAVDEAGLSDEKVPLDLVAGRIVRLIKGL